MLLPMLYLLARVVLSVSALVMTERAPPLPICGITYDKGSLAGIATPSGACRYVVRYAQIPERWGYSYIATDLNNQVTTDLPPACPQEPGSIVDGKTQSEDCLFATIYTPATIPSTASLPVFVWLHGGSFIKGSASAPGLDGSYLATKGNIIVIVLQYRLGVLGFLPPSVAPASKDPNLGVLDVINGLKAISQYIGVIGGDKARVTIGGQSSGAGMIRTLLCSPPAKGLFRAAILQSDPMAFGLASRAITSQLQSYFYSSSPMSSCKTLACLQGLPISEIIAAQDQLIDNAPYDITGIPLAEALRPTYGTNTIPADPTSLLFTSPASLPIPPSSLPLLITTVKNEAGSAISALFPSPIPINQTTYLQILTSFFNPSTAKTIYNSGLYPLSTSSESNQDGDEFRDVLERLSTDATWRCAARDVASKWAAAGGKVWVGEWRQGVSYPDNQSGYCSKGGRVCHEDDIFPTFHTAPGNSVNTSRFEDDIASYWISFITNSDPSHSSSKRETLCPEGGHPERSQYHQLHEAYSRANPSSNTWKAYSQAAGTNGVYPLGGDGQIIACPAGFWGREAKYDWQLYG